MLGLSLDRLLQAESIKSGAALTSRARGTDIAASFGRAKHCILLFLYGSPSQLETFDMKPDAPVEIRGDDEADPLVVPGLRRRANICRAPRVSWTGDGRPLADASVSDPRRRLRHDGHRQRSTWRWNCARAIRGTGRIIGSVVEYVDAAQREARRPCEYRRQYLSAVPLQQPADRRSAAGRAVRGFPGRRYNPKWTEFVGEGTRTVDKTLRTGFSFHGKSRTCGCTPDSRFRMSDTGVLPGMTLDRSTAAGRCSHSSTRMRRDLERSPAGRPLTTVPADGLSRC